MLQYLTFVIIIVLLFFAVSKEKQDLYCNSESKKCHGGNGKYYYYGRHKDTDRISESLDKLEFLSHCDQNTPKWRRCFISSFAVIILLCMMYFKSFPSAQELMIMFSCIFIVQYAFFSYYQYHYYQYPATYTRDIVHALRTKLKKKRGEKLTAVLSYDDVKSNSS